MNFMGDFERDRGRVDMGVGMLQGGRRGQQERGRGMEEMGRGQTHKGIGDMLHGDFVDGLAREGLGAVEKHHGRQDKRNAQMGMDRGMGMNGMAMQNERERGTMETGMMVGGGMEMGMGMQAQQDRSAIDPMGMGGMGNEVIVENQGLGNQVFYENQPGNDYNYNNMPQQDAIYQNQDQDIGYNGSGNMPQQQLVYQDQGMGYDIRPSEEVIIQNTDYGREEEFISEQPQQYGEIVNEEVYVENKGYGYERQQDFAYEEGTENQQKQELIVQNQGHPNEEEVIVDRQLPTEQLFVQNPIEETRMKMGPSMVNPVQEKQVVDADFFESPISVYKLFEWKMEFATMNKQCIELPSKIILIRDITKIKCLGEEAFQKHRQLKITHSILEDVFFAADIQKTELGFPIQYTWFAKLIHAKFSHLGIDINKPYIPEGQALNIILEGVFAKGMIYKKSQFLGKWELRYIVINPDGLFSYKTPNEPFSFSIKASSVKYIWTRFDQQNGHLIIKIKHGLEQTEFAIPSVNYFLKFQHNWLWAFYRLLMERNISQQLS